MLYISYMIIMRFIIFSERTSLTSYDISNDKSQRIAGDVLSFSAIIHNKGKRCRVITSTTHREELSQPPNIPM